MSTLLKTNGTIMGSEVETKVSSLAAKVLVYVKDNYKGKTFKNVAKIIKKDTNV